MFVDLEGSAARVVGSEQLASFSGFFDLAWTSDGRWILLSARTTDSGDRDIYALNIGEGDVELVAETSGEDGFPSFAGAT